MDDEREIFVDGRPLSDLRVVDLKKQCDGRGLSKSGSKNQIMERLKTQILSERLKNAESTKETAQSRSEDNLEESDLIRQYRQLQQQMIEIHRHSQSEGSQSESDITLESPEKGITRQTGSRTRLVVKTESSEPQESENMRKSSRRKSSSSHDKHEKTDEDRGRSRRERRSSGRIARGKDLWEEGEVEDEKDNQQEEEAQEHKKIEDRKDVHDHKKNKNQAKNEIASKKDEREVKNREKEQDESKVAKRNVEMADEIPASILTGDRIDLKKLDHKESRSDIKSTGNHSQGKQSKDKEKCQDLEVRKKDDVSSKKYVADSNKKSVAKEKEKDVDEQKEDGEITEEQEVTESSIRQRSRSTSSSESKGRSVSESDGEKTQQKPKIHKEFCSESESEDEKPRRRSHIQRKVQSGSESEDGKPKQLPETKLKARSSRSSSASSTASSRSRSRDKSRSRSRSSKLSRSRSRSSHSNRARSRSKSSRSRSRSKSPKDKAKKSQSDGVATDHNLAADKEKKPVPMETSKVDVEKSLHEPKEEGELSQDSEEKLTPKTSRRISLTGRIKEDGAEDLDNKENIQKEAQEKPIRKRKWGSSTSKSPKKVTSMAISTDSLKGLIPDIKSVGLNLPVLDLDNNTEMTFSDQEEDKRDVKIRRTVIQVVKEESEDSNENSEEEKDAEPERQPQEPDTKTKAKVETKERKKVEKPKMEPKIVRQISKPSHVNEPDEPKAARRSPSPARNPVNKVIHIANLVRPFTVGQLQELLKRSGTLVEGAFWIDKIKSHCYVSYETDDQASSARKALHGTKWPSSNPKILQVDYASTDELEFHRYASEGVANKPPGKPSKSPKKEEREQQVREKEEREKENEKKREIEKKTIKKKEEPKPIREWDRGKIRDRQSKEREMERDRRERGRDRPRSPSPRDRRRRMSDQARSGERDKRERKEKKVEEEPPAKLLDDLFRKTKTTPCIYWLPLTEARIVEREKEKQQRTLEREKRRKEMEEKEKQAKSKRSGSPEQRPTKSSKDDRGSWDRMRQQRPRPPVRGHGDDLGRDRRRPMRRSKSRSRSRSRTRRR